MTDTTVLDEPKPNSIEELFSRDPHSLTDADLDSIIEQLRLRRSAWQTKEAAAKAKADAKKSGDGKPGNVKVDLNDLGDL